MHDFYRKGGTEALQNGIRLLNIDFEGYKNIKIPVPPLEIQNKIEKEIQKIEKKEAEGNISIDKAEQLKLEIFKECIK